jgi:hypothetical protein
MDSRLNLSVPVRELVWTLLSDLFVDTNLQERDLRTRSDACYGKQVHVPTKLNEFSVLKLHLSALAGCSMLEEQ